MADNGMQQQYVWAFEHGPPTPEYIFVEALCNEMRKGFTASDAHKADDLKAALASIPDVMFVRDLKHVDAHTVKTALEREDVGELFSILQEFVHGIRGKFPVLTSRSVSPTTEEAIGGGGRGGMREPKITSQYMGKLPVEQMGGPYKVGMIVFPDRVLTALRELIGAGGGLHSNGVIKTQIFHIIFVFIVLAFKTVFIDRTTKARIAYLLFTIDGSWPLEKLMNTIGHAITNRRAGRHIGYMEVNKREAEELQCVNFIDDLAKFGVKIKIDETAVRLLPRNFTLATLMRNPQNDGGTSAGGTSAGGHLVDRWSALANSAGANSTGANSAGTNSAGTNSAGTNSAGTISAGANSAGANSAGTDSAGTDSASAVRSVSATSQVLSAPPSPPRPSPPPPSQPPPSPPPPSLHTLSRPRRRCSASSPRRRWLISAWASLPRRPPISTRRAWART